MVKRSIVCAVCGLLLLVVLASVLGCDSPASPKPKSSNANLSGITLSSGTLNPVFNPNQTAYTVSAPNSVTSVTVTGTKADSSASLSSNNGVAQSLNVGTNTITIIVTAQDGVTTKSYAITVDRAGDYTSDYIGTLKYVPAGSFQRDATATNISVITQPYRMSQEISRAQFAARFSGSDPSSANRSTGTTDPVQQVNWYHAIAFCNKLSIGEDLTPVYSVSGVNFNTLTFEQIPAISDENWNAATANWDADGYRLPTEMEWMWAAMGATLDSRPGAIDGEGINRTGYAKAFSGSDGSNAIGDYVVYHENAGPGDTPSWNGSQNVGTTRPVDSKLPNELGLHNMSGNVYEWCWDPWQGSYPTGTQIDYRGASSSTDRPIRGGSWSNVASYCTGAIRFGYNPNYQSHSIGFRVVRP